jgi:hypothetical protein
MLSLGMPPAANGPHERCTRVVVRAMGGIKAHSGPARDEGDGTLSRRRWRLPDDALIEFEIGLGLSQEVPVQDWLGSVLPGGRGGSPM